MSSIYPPSYPSYYDLDAMTGFGGNYWYVPGFTDDTYENVIGIFKGNTAG